MALTVAPVVGCDLTGIPLFHSIPKRDGKKLIDDMWLYTALAMIGENFEAGEELCGAVIRCAWLPSRFASLRRCVAIQSGRCPFRPRVFPCLFPCILPCSTSACPHRARLIPLRDVPLSPPLPPSSLRKAGDRGAVWTKTASAEKACLEIGGEFRSAIAECLQGEVMDENERPRALAC